ncbi:MAG: hypothetical protein ACOVS5_01750 [Oligoflexus sp.]|jgi:hypothetical protein
MRYGKLFLSVLLLASGWLALGQTLFLPRQQRVLDQARYVLEHWSISYVYGGSSWGDRNDCEQCNSCLAAKKPDKTLRLAVCPSCSSCSLDCSHFTYEVFKHAGLSARYLTTALMNRLDAPTLLRDYHLVDIGRRSQRALPGDLLVYDGHVVMLEKRHRDGRGDIIHVTSGRDLRGPGLGVQRERLAAIDSYRGPLLRILRHVELVQELRHVFLERKRLSPSGGAKGPAAP